MKQRYPRLILLSLSFIILSTATAQAQCPLTASCTPGRASSPQAATYGMGIFNVTVGSINNTTAGQADGYQDTLPHDFYSYLMVSNLLNQPVQ